MAAREYSGFWEVLGQLLLPEVVPRSGTSRSLGGRPRIRREGQGRPRGVDCATLTVTRGLPYHACFTGEIAIQAQTCTVLKRDCVWA